MTPQMQQSIQLLQMNSMELETLAQTEMLENPFLEDNETGDEPDAGAEEAESSADERAESIDSDENAATDTQNEPVTEAPTDDTPELAEEKPEEKFEDVDADWESYFDGNEPTITSRPSTYEAPEDETDFSEYTAAKVSLYEKLTWQLETATFDEEDHPIGEYLISNIDDNGYFVISDVDDDTPFDMTTQELMGPVRVAASDLDVSEDDVSRVLSVIQTFEPVGVGARNLVECLSIQLRDRGVDDPLPYRMLEEQFDRLARRKFKDMAKALGAPEQDIRDAFEMIARLEPKPGRSITTESPRYIRPDVYVKEVDGRYIYSLHEGDVGRLRINDYYRRLLRNNSSSMTDKEREYAIEKYKSALWLIKNIEKRKSTILNVTEAIMNYQQDFLDKGVEALRPLTLKQIAEEVGMHESTIARVTNSKYVETTRGTFSLKYFFSSSLDTDSGGTTSSRSIKQAIENIIADEDTKKPLSDQKIATILANRGVQIARRTVAKYREQMKILPAKLRKEV